MHNKKYDDSLNPLLRYLFPKEKQNKITKSLKTKVRTNPYLKNITNELVRLEEAKQKM